MRLAEQGLVRSEPQQGFSVMSISAEDLRELTELRCELEGLAVRRSIAEGDMTWEAGLIAAHHVMERTSTVNPDNPQAFSEQWALAHATFHRALLDGCTNRRMKTLVSSVRDSAELYRRWTLPIGHDLDRDVAGEHRRLLQAALARDADTAHELIVRHITRTSEVLLCDPLVNTEAEQA